MFAFASANPWLFAACWFAACWVLWRALGLLVIAHSARIRHANIRYQGWPPAHCDADGDPVESDDSEFMPLERREPAPHHPV